MNEFTVMDDGFKSFYSNLDFSPVYHPFTFITQEKGGDKKCMNIFT